MRGFILRVWRLRICRQKWRNRWGECGHVRGWWARCHWRDFDEYIGTVDGRVVNHYGWHCNGYHKRWRSSIDIRRCVNHLSYANKRGDIRYRENNDLNRWRVKFGSLKRRDFEHRWLRTCIDWRAILVKHFASRGIWHGSRVYLKRWNLSSH
jgi:hypothetical protein